MADFPSGQPDASVNAAAASMDNGSGAEPANAREPVRNLLRIMHLGKAFGTRPLLDIRDFSIQAGQAYALTGANGVGKTTLLRILAGLEQADSAQLAWHDRPLSLTPYPASLRQNLVYVHQHPVMFATTVANNIGYGLVARNVPTSERIGRIEQALAWAGLSTLRTRKATTLSGGEKQRLALARAWILQPELLLLDEPTSSLDGMAREQVIALIHDWVAAGKSLVIACHDRDLIAIPGLKRVKLRDGSLKIR